MRPVYQTHFAVPSDEGPPGWPLGNCYQAALATLLGADLEDVPHIVMTHGPDHPDVGPSWWVALRLWLRSMFDLDMAWYDAEKYPTPRHVLLDEPPPGWLCLASGKSPRGDHGHIVVVDADGQLVHDPRPLDMPGPRGLDGPPRGFDVLVPPYEWA